jgi:hypothetical protein
VRRGAFPDATEAAAGQTADTVYAVGSEATERAVAPWHRADGVGLAELMALADELDAAIRAAVTGLRGFASSWGENRLPAGHTRQAAQ